MFNFLKYFIRFGSKIQSTRRIAHYNVSTKDAFKICRNYENFLKVMLGDGEGPFNFEWTKKGPGEVGAEVKYGLKRDGMLNTIWEEITQIEFDKKTGSYILSWKNIGSTPWLPIKGYQSHWEIKPCSDKSDQPLCELVWTQTFPTPLLLGFISLAGMIKKSLNGTGSIIINFIFRQYYEQEFPSTDRRLPKKGDRVAIIGAGPSGLHMAHLLKNKVGVDKIKIFERSDRIGGKTVTIDSTIKEREKGRNTGKEERVVHELGTCYMHPAYFSVRAYMQELKEMMSEKLHEKFPEFAEEVAPIHYSINRIGKQNLSLKGWITANLQIQPKFSFMALFRILIPGIDTSIELFRAKIKYNRLHRKIFGTYDYSLPPRLSKEGLESIDMSFGQFLDQHGLTALSPILAYGNTAQGYGSIEKVPAFWAMCWITPDLMNGYFRLPKPKPARKAMFKSGWKTMWEATVDVNQFMIELSTDINKIDRLEDGPIIITANKIDKCGKPISEKFKEEFDYLVVAAPLYDKNLKKGDSPPPWETLNCLPNKTVPLNLKPNETALLQSPTLTHSQFRTVLFKLKDPKPYLYAHLIIRSDKLLGPGTGEGDVFASRDSYLAHNPYYCTWEGHIKDPMRGALREQMAYQWVNDDKDVPLSHFQDKFEEWTLANLGSKEHYEILQEQHWNYFQRYDREGINQFFPWKVVELQGANNTLFVHASTFFESVLDIVNYNNMLVEGLSGNLNTLRNPKQFEYKSKAIAENKSSPPLRYLQKPFYYQTDHWKLFYNKFVKLCLAALDILLGVIWTLLYIPIRPILSVTLIRWQRYQLQKSFKTENPGKWYQYSMKHFIKVSPSVRCYVNEAENKKNHNHDLNEVDPVMRDSKKELKKNYPYIPKVNKALMLGYADYRTVVQVWMEQIKPNFLTFIGPKIKSIINWFALSFPVTFNYIGSWSTVLGFNLLTGYSLRIEDDKGGGCYVPKCSMLATARKEYGDELGCKICSHVCKIFTEESMKRKGIPVTLEPNYEKGSCMIRSVPVQTSAFHDHSLFNGMELLPETKNPAGEGSLL